MKALHLKALRDLWHMRGQSLAIALVIAMGVATLVMAQSTLLSLKNTQAELYSDLNFSEVWVSVKRAPVSEIKQIENIQSVAAVEARLSTGAKLTISNFDESVSALVLSLPSQQNKLYLQTGHLPESAHEIVLSAAFANAHNMSLGERVYMTVNGKAQWFTVSAIATSAEFFYQVKPGTLFPDFKRYAIVWMHKDALFAALDMDQSFNQAVLRLTPNANEDEVIAALDRQLARYGSTGALGRSEQVSHAILDGEFNELTLMALFYPTTFLAVAAFLLNMVFKRLIAMQRDKIAIIKAFGYSTWQVVVHYGLIVSLMTALGIVLGIGGGVFLGHGVATLYRNNFNFPYLYFTLDWQVVVFGAVVSLLAALSGTVFSVYGAASEPVAVAMRPPTPQRYKKTFLEYIGFVKFLAPTTRMIFRQLERHPFKALLTIFAIAFASALVMMTQFSRASIERMMAVDFRLANRHDISASLIEDRPASVINDLKSLNGVEQVEGLREVAVRIKHNNQQKLVSLQGIKQDAQLRQLVTTKLQPVALPTFGLTMDEALAKKLNVEVGDYVWVDILASQQQLHLPVVLQVPSHTGLRAYMDLDTLNRQLGNADLINNVRLTVTSGQEKQVLSTLNDYPQILAAEERNSGLLAVKKMIDENLVVFMRIVLFMGIIVNFGILYNTVRMNLNEHSRELASLRVLGLHKSEVAYILYGELAILVILSIPLGLVIGEGIAMFIMNSMQSDLYRLQMVRVTSAYTQTALVTIISAFVSALAVYPQLHNLDLIEVLKTRE